MQVNKRFSIVLYKRNTTTVRTLQDIVGYHKSWCVLMNFNASDQHSFAQNLFQYVLEKIRRYSLQGFVFGGGGTATMILAKTE